jgi:hypothetical protein
MKKPSLIRCASLALALAGIMSARAAAGTEIVYAPDFESMTGTTLEGWSKIGDAATVVDWATNTASGVPALFFDSMFYEPNGGSEVSADTILTGDTGVSYDRSATYRLSFVLARVKTGGFKKAEENEVTFYGGLKYQLWAGDPDSTGVLLGEGREPAVRAGETPKNHIINFTVPPQARGAGSLFIRIATIGAPAHGDSPYRYQQAEINDLRIEKITTQ